MVVLLYSGYRYLQIVISHMTQLTLVLTNSNWRKEIRKYLLMPSPSASSKFGSSILKIFKHAQIFMYTQNHFGILKS